MSKNTKAEKVVDVALELLKNEGDYAVTMRRVATNAGMSLSNVQYYFKNKDALLVAMADRYFKACLDEVGEIQVIQADARLEENVKAIVETFLKHGLEISEMCRIFREYWAISARNEEIDKYLKDYYRELAVLLSEISVQQQLPKKHSPLRSRFSLVLSKVTP